VPSLESLISLIKATKVWKSAMIMSNRFVFISILICHSVSVTAFVNPSTLLGSSTSSVLTSHGNKYSRVSSRRGNRGTALFMSTSTGKDFYRILGVSRDADAKTIKSAYRRKAKEFHPGKILVHVDVWYPCNNSWIFI
jgi:hypothetical protein